MISKHTLNYSIRESVHMLWSIDVAMMYIYFQ